MNGTGAFLRDVVLLLRKMSTFKYFQSPTMTKQEAPNQPSESEEVAEPQDLSDGIQRLQVSDGLGMSRFTAEDVEDIIAVAVMSVTGSGKSNFIMLASGSDTCVVGHNLASCKSHSISYCDVQKSLTDRAKGTQEIKSYEFLSQGHRILLFDTPGFDDTYRLDADILAELAETLSAMYKNKLKL